MLPLSSINYIISQIKEAEADDHIVLQDFINQVLEKNSANQGKNDVVNVLNDPINMASSTEGDSATTAVVIVQP